MVSMSTPPTSYLVLDIETVPDTDLFAPPEPAPGVDRPFPPLYACRPVVLGVMWIDEALGCQKIGTIGEGKDEAGLLAHLTQLMTPSRPHPVTRDRRRFAPPVPALRPLPPGDPFPLSYPGP